MVISMPRNYVCFFDGRLNHCPVGPLTCTYICVWGSGNTYSSNTNSLIHIRRLRPNIYKKYIHNQTCDIPVISPKRCNCGCLIEKLALWVGKLKKWTIVTLCFFFLKKKSSFFLRGPKFELCLSKVWR